MSKVNFVIKILKCFIIVKILIPICPILWKILVLYRYLQYGQKYGISLYEQYSQNMIREVNQNCFEKSLKETNGSEECIDKIMKKYSTEKLGELKTDYLTYLEQLVSRSSI